MKVLLINPHIFSTGGAEKVVLASARYLRKLGVDCDVLTLSLDEKTKHMNSVRFIMPSKEIKYGINISPFSIMKKKFIEFNNLILGVKNIIQNYDIFNPHNNPSNWIFSLLKKGDARVVWTCHNVFDAYGPTRAVFEKSWVLGQLLQNLKVFDKQIVSRTIDAIVTPSTSYAKKVFRSYGCQCYVIPPGIEVEKYSQGDGDAFRERYKIRESFLAVHIGALISRKCQEISIKAITILKNVIPNIRLAIIGSGPDEEKLKQLVSALNVKRNVIFTGRLNEVDLKNAYHAADVNLLPSTLESFGLTPLEALASNTISIVSNETGVSEYLQRYNIGYVMGSKTSSELVKQILHIYRKTSEVEEKVKKARDILQTQFSWSRYARNLLRVYKATSRSAAPSANPTYFN